jgi:hypothetical protein
MGLFDKVKNLFTEEIEEEPQPIKKEVRHIEVAPSKPLVEKESIEKKEEPIVSEEKTTREEKFVFFSDDDFKDLEKPKATIEPKKEITKTIEKPLAYKGAVPQTKVEPKKEFKPSPIISPVYGVLNKNYQKEEIKSKKPTSPRIYRSSLTVDEVRNKAYGTLEDEIKDDLLGKTMVEEEPTVQSDINIFEELDNEVNEEPVILSRSNDNVDEIFGKLDNKKEEILDELDNKKEEILDEIDSKKEDLLSSDYNEEYIDDVDLSKKLLDDEEDFDLEIEKDSNDKVEDDTLDDTEALAKELEEQKKKLSEINDMMNENKKTTKTKTSKKKANVEEDLDESELFDLIDSIYEKKDDE